MNDLILKAREERLIDEKTDLVKAELMSEHGVSAEWCSENHLLIKQYVATTPGNRAKDIASGMMTAVSNYGASPVYGGQGPTQATGLKGRTGGALRRLGQTAKAPVKGAIRLGSAAKAGLDNLAVTGQQNRTGVTPKDQADLSAGQKGVTTGNAVSNLQRLSVDAGKPAPMPGQTAQQVTDSANQANKQVDAAAAAAAPPAPDLDQLTADEKVQQVNNQGQQQPQAQAPKGSPQEMAQATQIQEAQQQANTRGGIGTGAISNFLTLGMSGLARGAYNAYQRNQGKQRLNQYAQGNFTRSLQFQNELNDAYGVLALRKGYEARNTTEMLRNGGRRQV